MHEAKDGKVDGMRLALALSAVVLLGWWPRAAAEAGNLIQIRGRVDAVDCGAQTLVLRTRSGTTAVALAPRASVRLNTFPVDLCALRPLAGSVAVAWIAPLGDHVRAIRVEAYSAASTVTPPQAYYPCCPLYPGFAGFPGIGVGIGFDWRPWERPGWDDR